MLDVGDSVPDFSLKGSDGKTYSPRTFRGKKWVLYFYPKDKTPGCTQQACDFTSNIERFTARGVPVHGVSGGTVAQKQDFIRDSKIGFPLLADEDNSVAKAFGAWGEKNLYGKKSEGILRMTFLIDESGKIEKVWRSVKVDGHVAKVLDALQ